MECRVAGLGEALLRRHDAFLSRQVPIERGKKKSVTDEQLNDDVALSGARV